MLAWPPRVCLPFTDAGTQEAVVHVGAWKQDSGAWAARCLKTTRETTRGQLDVQQGCQSWRDIPASGGKSGVCVEELTWRQV